MIYHRKDSDNYSTVQKKKKKRISYDLDLAVTSLCDNLKSKEPSQLLLYVIIAQNLNCMYLSALFQKHVLFPDLNLFSAF